MGRYEINNIPAAIDFGDGEDWVERTLKNAKNLLLCQKGEVPYDRYRGFDPALYDLSLDELNEALIEEIDRVMLWEPDVKVVSATAEALENMSVIIRVVVEIEEEEDE